MFNLSLSTCSIPKILRGGDSSDVNNYRPISITCTCLFYKSLFLNQLSQYLNSFNILSPFQSGFRPNFSTTIVLKFTMCSLPLIKINLPVQFSLICLKLLIWSTTTYSLTNFMLLILIKMLLSGLILSSIIVVSMVFFRVISLIS